MKYYYTALIIALVIILLWNRFRIERFLLDSPTIPFKTPSTQNTNELRNKPTSSITIPIAQTWQSASTNWVNPNQMVTVSDCYQLLTPEQIQTIQNSVVENFTDDDSSIRLPAGSKQVSPTYLMPPGMVKETPFLRKDKSIVLEPIQGSTQSVLTPGDWTRINNTLTNQVNNVLPIQLASIPGRIGPTGPRGTQGAPGEVGPVGSRGEPGEIGPAGPVGLPGPIGLDGPRGEVGPAGPKGDTGPAGPIGPQGERGLIGLRGEKGEIGPAGPPGIQGIQGRDGLPGRSITLTPEEAGNVTAYTTGPPGPKGDQGPIGVTGPVGPRGERGLEGATGPAGPKGDQGPAGPVGDSGLNGLANQIGIIFQGLLNNEDTLQATTSSNQSQIVNDAINRRGLVLAGNKLGPNGQSNIYMDDNAHVKNNMFVGNNLQVKNRIGMVSNANTYGSYMSMDNNAVAFRGGIISNGSFVDNFPTDYADIRAKDGLFQNGIKVNDGSIYVDVNQGNYNQYGSTMDDGSGNFLFTGLRAYGVNHANKGSVDISTQGSTGKIRMGVQGKNALQVRPSGNTYIGEWDTTNDDGVYDGALNVKQLQKDKNTLSLMNTSGDPNIHFMSGNEVTGAMSFGKNEFQIKNADNQKLIFDKQGRLGLGGTPQSTLHLLGQSPSLQFGNNVEMTSNNNTFTINDVATKKGLTVKSGKVGISNNNPTASLDINGTMAIRNGGLLIDRNGFVVKDETKDKKVAEFSGENGNFGLQLPANIKPSSVLSLGGTPGSKLNLAENGTNNYPGLGSSGNDVFMHMKDDTGSFTVYDTIEKKKNLLAVTGKGKFGIRSADPQGDFCIEDTCMNKRDIYEVILNNKRFIAADAGKGFLGLTGNKVYRLNTVPRMNPKWEPFQSGGSSWFVWMKKPETFSNTIILRREAESQMGISITSGGFVYGFIGMKTAGDFETGLSRDVSSYKKERKTINQLALQNEDIVQLCVVYVRLDDSVLMKMYVNGVLEWQYIIPFDVNWKLTPGELYYGSSSNTSNINYKIGMATFFDLPFTDADVNQMYWLQRDNMKFQV